MVFGFLRKKSQPLEFESKEERVLRETDIKLKQRARRERELRKLKSEREWEVSGTQVGRSVGRFATAGLRREEPFTAEQEALKSMFGGGEKIWGWRNEPVEINNDLNPRQRGDNGTAELFGFG